jgi:site-specific recombinase XerD
LARHFGRSPDQLGAEELRAFQLHLVDRGVSWSLFNQTVCASKLFYGQTLGRPDVVPFVRFGKRPKKLPVVLAPEEVVQLFAVAQPGVERVRLQTDYALGLRVSELSRLPVTDLDSRRMVVHVHAGKGCKDRLVPLSPKLLAELRAYWRQYRPTAWLFPGKKPGTHRSAASVQRLVRRVTRRAGLTKAVTVHTLRHSYATHQLEAGVDDNSCRNRHCPKCQAGVRARWLERERGLLLPVDYHHVVFTLPHQLNPLVLGNPAACYGLLFHGAWATLREVASDPRYLGAELGAVAVLHTWGQTLSHHPHLHWVVTGGPCQQSLARCEQGPGDVHVQGLRVRRPATGDDADG